jgi:hypothetical protein
MTLDINGDDLEHLLSPMVELLMSSVELRASSEGLTTERLLSGQTSCTVTIYKGVLALLAAIG